MFAVAQRMTNKKLVVLVPIRDTTFPVLLKLGTWDDYLIPSGKSEHSMARRPNCVVSVVGLSPESVGVCRLFCDRTDSLWNADDASNCIGEHQSNGPSAA